MYKISNNYVFILYVFCQKVQVLEPECNVHWKSHTTDFIQNYNILNFITLCHSKRQCKEAGD